MARYTGECPKVKMQIKGSNSVTYTYNLGSSEYEAFPCPPAAALMKLPFWKMCLTPIM